MKKLTILLLSVMLLSCDEDTLNISNLYKAWAVVSAEQIDGRRFTGIQFFEEGYMRHFDGSLVNYDQNDFEIDGSIIWEHINSQITLKWEIQELDANNLVLIYQDEIKYSFVPF